MSTLIDTNIWIDLTEPSPRFDASAKSIVLALGEGPVILSAVVWAELTAGLGPDIDIEAIYSVFAYRREAFPFAAAYPAGQAHRLYRQRGGRRDRTLPDFLIGAHALVGGHRLLTRDPVRYRSYFPDLEIMTPEGTV
ncbi:type II toxin-antitoxin system VapC family toxin [Fulvimarina sp. MAC3]|uniref:type II toxin-antitoxin system VapC family toxin n=1 Tax=Fulvimarina sp. MAC3 TaxID=3148887 RepID=UPI0031FDC042